MTPAPTICSVCGAVTDLPAAQVALTWTRDTDGRGRAGWVCPECTRAHVRSIEAKLDHEWW